jgi:hypothetical protein
MPIRTALVSAIALVLGVACAPPAAEPPRSFVDYLENNGQQFVTVPDPGRKVVPPEVVVQNLQRDRFPPFVKDWTADLPVLGVVRCVSVPCQPDGELVVKEPGRQRLIWVVGFPDEPGANGGTAWAIVDAVTGQPMIGDGPAAP